jgi:hypothetical protein
MKKTLLAVALSFTGAAIAQSPGGGGISTREVMPELRTKVIVIDGLAQRIVDANDDNRNGADHLATSASVIAGNNGVVGKVLLGATTAAVDATSTFAAFPFPSKVRLHLVEVNSGAAVTCANIVIYGFNQFGEPVRDDSITSLAEISINEDNAANKVSSKVFEKITRVTATSCTNSEAAVDYIAITATHQIGLPFKISGGQAIKSVCYNRTGTTYSTASTTVNQICLKPNTAPDGTGDDDTSTDSSTEFDAGGYASRVDVTNHALDLDTSHATTGTIAASPATTVIITLRSPNGSK